MSRRNIIIKTVLFIIIALVPRLSYSMDISVGATAWYSKWEPMWDENFSTLFDPDTAGIEEKHLTNMDPALLYGPVISVRFLGNWRVSSSLLYGNYTSNTISLKYEDPDTYAGESEMDIKKLDHDTTLTYSFFRYFSIFAGYKFQYYKFTKDWYSSFPTTYILTRNLKSQSIGPGMGLGVTIPLADGFAILVNISGIMLFMEMEDKWEPYSTKTGYPTYNYSMTARGFSTSFSLAYYVSKLNITFVTGFKYQYLKFQQNSVSGTDPATLTSEDIRRPKDYNNTEDVFLGINLAILYSFSL